MTTAAQKDFFTFLKECRESLDLSESDLAVEIGMNRSTISRAEHSRIPTPKVFQYIVRALRERGCSETKLEQLETTWQRSRDEEEGRKIEPSEFRTIMDVLAIWPAVSVERKSLMDELQFVAENWKTYHVGQHELEKGYPSNARDIFEELKDKAKGQPWLMMRVLQGCALTFRYLGQMKSAFAELDNALRIAEQLGEPALWEQFTLLKAKGDFHRRIGELDEALECYAKGFKLVGKVKDQARRALGFAILERKKACVLLFRGEATEAEMLSKTSIQRCKELGERDEERKGQQHLAWALAIQGRFDRALGIHQHIVENINIIPFDEQMKARRYLADALRMCGRLEEAEKQYLEVRQRLRENAEPLLEEQETLIRGPVALGLAQVYRKLGRLDDAATWLEQSEKINQSDPLFLALTESEMGFLSMAKGEFAEAERRFARAHSIFEHQHNAYYLMAMLVNKAELAFRQGNVDLARSIAKGIIKQSSGKNDLKTHRARGHVWLASANSIKPDGGNTMAEYFEALRIAFEELDNAYLFGEILDRLKEQKKSWESDGQGKDIQQLAASIIEWRGRLGSSSPAIQERWAAWVEQMSMGGKAV